MALPKEELRRLLSNEEPDYAAIAAQMDEASVPALNELSQDPDVMLATKAVYLASMLSQAQAHQIVERASVSAQPLVQIAAATALQNLPDPVRHKLASQLLDVDDVSIRKLVINAVKTSAPADLKTKIERLSTQSNSEFIRSLSKTTLQRINR